MSFKRKETQPVMAWYREDTSSWAFATPDYNEAFKEDFKEQVPAEYRSWDGVNKLWTVHEDYSDVLEDLFEEYFPHNQLVWAEEGEQYEDLVWG